MRLCLNVRQLADIVCEVQVFEVRYEFLRDAPYVGGQLDDYAIYSCFEVERGKRVNVSPTKLSCSAALSEFSYII